MPVSRKSKKNFSKKRKNVERSKKTRKHIRKMKGGASKVLKPEVKPEDINLIDSVLIPNDTVINNTKYKFIQLPILKDKPKDLIMHNKRAQTVIEKYFGGNAEILYGGQLLHASTSSSLFIFTNYNRKHKLCCKMYPTGYLLKKGLIPFGGELSNGIVEGGINNKYISTILLGEYNDHFKNVYLKSQNSTLNNKNIVSTDNNYLTQQKKTLTKLIEEEQIFTKSGITQKINIVKQRIENYKILEDIEKTLLNLQFPVLYAIRISNERLINSIEWDEIQNENVNDKITYELVKRNLIYFPVISVVNGEIGVKDYIDHTEIKTIFVPTEYVDLVNSIVNGKTDEEGIVIKIPIQPILPTMI